MCVACPKTLNESGNGDKALQNEPKGKGAPEKDLSRREFLQKAGQLAVGAGAAVLAAQLPDSTAEAGHALWFYPPFAGGSTVYTSNPHSDCDWPGGREGWANGCWSDWTWNDWGSWAYGRFGHHTPNMDALVPWAGGGAIAADMNLSWGGVNTVYMRSPQFVQAFVQSYIPLANGSRLFLDIWHAGGFMGHLSYSHLANGLGWKFGDWIHTDDVIGPLYSAPGFPSHLHLEAVSASGWAYMLPFNNYSNISQWDHIMRLFH